MRARTHLFDSRMPAPPVRKRQFGMSMDLSLPKYQFWVMFSVLRTSAVLLGYTCSQGEAGRQPGSGMARWWVTEAD